MKRLALWLCLASIAVLPAFAAPTPVAVTPAKASVRAGASLQFGLQLYGVGAPLAWSVNGIPGGTAVVGTVSPAGLYAAPPSDPGTVIVVACAAGTPAVSAQSTVAWLNPEPSIASLAPAAVNVGTFVVSIHGAGFVPGSRVLLGGTAIPATIASPTLITFQTAVAKAGPLAVVVSNTDPGAAKSGARTLQVMEPVAITVAPTNTTARLGATRKLTAKVSNAVDKSVKWTVQSVPAGADRGSVADDGTYTAPLAMPPGGAVDIVATSVANPDATAHATVTLLNPVPEISGVAPVSLVYGQQTVLVSGRGFVADSVLRLGDVAFPTQFISPTQLSATVTLGPIPGRIVGLRVRNPDPGGAQSDAFAVEVGPADPKVGYLAAARFLEQASWGPDADSIARVQAIGFDAWIDEQLVAPISLFPASDSNSDSLVDQQSAFFARAMANPDQLRQRVAFALGQIFVVSGLKTGEPRQMVPYQNLVSTDAFGTYSQLLRHVTLSPTMGVYLDMVNNDKADAATGQAPNENYAREALQLFSIGTVLLNPDGSTRRDATGLPIATYNQAIITDLARAFTGWTYPGKAIAKGHNRENYRGAMIPIEANHDHEAKTIFLGMELPAGQTAQQDLDSVLQGLASHPNVPPFISLRLIQHLVTSNPSPEYLTRVSQVFVQSQGDLAKVVRAILLDPEARAGDDPAAPAPPGSGHLREPVLYLLAMLRTLDATVREQNPIESLGAEMGQKVFYPASVFNYYSPLYRTPGGIPAPEFQLMNSSSALVRANAVESLVSRGLDGDASWNMGPYQALAGNPSALVDAVDNAFLYGRLPDELKANIVAAVSATKDTRTRIRNAIYLVATSSLYQVQH